MIRNLELLKPFVIVSKHLSFTKAAKELFLSQAAVSVQIKHLEEELGFKLFHRKARKIYLTQEGEKLLKSVEPALQNIHATIASIKSTDGTYRLTVSTLPSFAAKWLIPNLTNFQQKHPKFALKVHVSNNRVNFFDEQVDCAIRFGLGKYPGLNTTHLADDIYFPVCHPNIRNNYKPFNNPEEIKRFILLHDGSLGNTISISWKLWAENMGVDDLDLKNGNQYDQADHAIQAAIAGQGVALGRFSLVEKDLKNGLLVPLFDSILKSRFSYYFVHPEEYTDNLEMDLFKQWIKNKMKELQTGNTIYNGSQTT